MIAFVYLGISTLQSWASKIEMRQGILQGVFKILEVSANTMTTTEKLVVLLFDEVKVCELYEYDKKYDEIVGPHSQMQVVMARSLFGKWKQPVFVDFDTKMTSNILENIITQLYRIGFTVVACVSDCGGGNIGLWKSLNIGLNNTHIKHPIAESNIYFFADTPHLLKLIRNWLLDVGFKLGNGKIVNKNPLTSLLELSSTEITVTHKLTEKHIICEGYQRQKVSLAAELLSHTTASALSYYLPGANEEAAQTTSEFISLVNAWFDIMNSYVPTCSIRRKSAYGKSLNEQNKILDDMYHTVENMICIGKRSLQIFQKGILLSIQSLKCLYADLHNKYEIEYILTHKLNQDALENLFSQLREGGGLNDHPTPLNALYRLRMIILGKPNGNLSTNSKDQGNEEFIVGKVLRSAKLNLSVTNFETNECTAIYQESENTVDGDIETGPSTAASKDVIETTEEDGLHYLAGWIAKKLRKSHPELGNYTSKVQYNNKILPSWIKHLSFGGLVEPSNEWKNKITELENNFKKYFGNEVIHMRNTTRILVNNIKKSVDVDETILRTFVKQRLFIRINYLNTQKEAEKLRKRKLRTALQDDIQRKNIKKLKKITN